MNKNCLKACLLAATLSFAGPLYAEETNAEKVETGVNKAGDAANQARRKMKDEVCEMVDGKMKCVAKKMAHKAKNLGDKMGTKATDIENKAD
jgi:hypothetical protein